MKSIKKKAEKKASLKNTPKSSISSNYFTDTFNGINSYFHKGLWILGVEFTFLAIKQSLNHCSKKINPAAYSDLYDLKIHFFNHIADNVTNGIYIGTNGTYMYDLVNTTYTLLLDHFTTSNSHMLTTERVAIENLGYNISRQLPQDANNYKLHSIYCSLYYVIYRYGYNELSKLQYNAVKKARANYRLKDDIISRISSERRAMLGFEDNLQEVIKQSNAYNKSDLNILIDDINRILQDVKPSYVKVFKLKIQGRTFGEISNILNYANESGSRKIYNKVVAILRERLKLSNYNISDNIALFNLTATFNTIE